MISRDRSDVMVNVFRCDRKAFNLITLLGNIKHFSIQLQFCEKRFLFRYHTTHIHTDWAKRKEKHVTESDSISDIWEWYEKGADIFCKGQYIIMKNWTWKLNLCQIARCTHWKPFLPWKMISEREINLSYTPSTFLIKRHDKKNHIKQNKNNFLFTIIEVSVSFRLIGLHDFESVSVSPFNNNY